MVLILKYEEVKASDGFVMDPTVMEKVWPPLSELVRKFDIVNVLGVCIVQVWVAETLVPDPETQSPLELAKMYSSGKIISTVAVESSKLLVVIVKL